MKPARTGFKLRALGRGNIKGFHQQAQGFALWPLLETPFEVADRAGGERGALSKFRLRQALREAVMTQQAPKRGFRFRT